MTRWPIGSPPSVRRSATWPTMPVPARKGSRSASACRDIDRFSGRHTGREHQEGRRIDRAVRSVDLKPPADSGDHHLPVTEVHSQGMESAWHEVGAQSAIVDSAIAGGEAASSRTLAGRE